VSGNEEGRDLYVRKEPSVLLCNVRSMKGTNVQEHLRPRFAARDQTICWPEPKVKEDHATSLKTCFDPPYSRLSSPGGAGGRHAPR
jgi:hypothetical protein